MLKFITFIQPLHFFFSLYYSSKVTIWPQIIGLHRCFHKIRICDVNLRCSRLGWVYALVSLAEIITTFHSQKRPTCITNCLLSLVSGPWCTVLLEGLWCSTSTHWATVHSAQALMMAVAYQTSFSITREHFLSIGLTAFKCYLPLFKLYRPFADCGESIQAPFQIYLTHKDFPPFHLLVLSRCSEFISVPLTLHSHRCLARESQLKYCPFGNDMTPL